MKRIIFITMILFCMGCTNTKVVEKDNNNNNDLKADTVILTMKSYVNAIEQAYIEKSLMNEEDYNNQTYYLVSQKKIESADKKVYLDIPVSGTLPDTSDKGEITIDENGQVTSAKLKFKSRYVTYCNENEILVSKTNYESCK